MPSKYTYRERMKLKWPAFAPTQERGAFEKLVPPQMPQYGTRVLIKKGKGLPTFTKEGGDARCYSQIYGTMNYINSETCGTLTLCCAHMNLPPGIGTILAGPHWHSVEIGYYCVSGQGYFEVEGERYDFQAGDWILVPMRTLHGQKNTGDGPLQLIAAKGLRLRSFDGPTECPIDYREFDRVEEPPGSPASAAPGAPGPGMAPPLNADEGKVVLHRTERGGVYRERMKLSWPTYSPTQDRGAFENLVPTQAIKYWTRVVIKKDEGIPVMTKEGRASGTWSQPSYATHYINSATCGALTLCCGLIECPPGCGSWLDGAIWQNAEEAFSVVSGRGFFEVEGERYDVEAGDWIFVPLRALHSYMNTGMEPLRLWYAKGVCLRSYDGPAQSPIDYREFEKVEGRPVP